MPPNSHLSDINTLALQRFAMKEAWFSAILLLISVKQSKE